MLKREAQMVEDGPDTDNHSNVRDLRSNGIGEGHGECDECGRLKYLFDGYCDNCALGIEIENRYRDH